MTVLTAMYRMGAGLVLPFFARSALKKLRGAGYPALRAQERLGHASIERPMGPLIWIHAASVGEGKSALTLIDRLLALAPQASVLVTTGTASSAEVLAPRLPERAFHQFAPLDGAGPVRWFLRHWKPDLGIFIESELWPNLIRSAHRSGAALALLNTRLSERSARRWSRFPASARQVIGRFGIIHCQDQRTAGAISALGLTHARKGVNLKSVLLPPEVNQTELAELRLSFGERPLWAAVSTHPGEEEIILAAHARLRERFPDAALILVPRHPERAEKILPLCTDHEVARRSTGGVPDGLTSVYLADTLGETDLWYALADLVCLCGSFSDVGGHTPFEPAAHGATILHGPRYANFEEVYGRFIKAGASLQVNDETDLTDALEMLFAQPEHANALGANALPLAQDGLARLDRLARQCLTLAGIEHD